MKPVAPVAPYGPMGLGVIASLNQPLGVFTPGIVPEQTSYPADERDTYHYQNDPSLYETNDTEHQLLKLYEERLIAKKNALKQVR